MLEQPYSAAQAPDSAAQAPDIFVTVLRRDLILAWRGRADILVSLAFFAVVVCLFPFGIGAEPNQLRKIAPSILWIAALLSTLLSLHRLFSQDELDGTLEQLLLSSEPVVWWVSAKICAHWIATGLPLLIATPVLALLFDMEQGALWVLLVSLALGTPVLSLIGAVGAALTLGLRGANVLLALLILPLFVPVLIFGAGAVDAFRSGSGLAAHLLLLGGGLLGALALAPIACAVALRVTTES